MPQHTTVARRRGRTWQSPEEYAAAQKGEHVGSWFYHAADGAPILAVVRLDTEPGNKTCRPLHPVNGGWAVGDPPGPLPLYALPELHRTTGRVYVVEGEKCAEGARSIGLTATTSAHGCRSAHKSNWTALAGREVVIVPDCDDDGEHYAATVAQIVSTLDPPTSVRVLRLPNLEEREDIADWLDRLDSKEPDALRAEIERLADAAPAWDAGATAIAPTELADEPVIVNLADVEPQPVEWLWPAKMAIGKITMVSGDPGVGKSFLMLDLAARVSAGSGFPDAPGVACEPGGVVILSAEDDVADTIRPRLDAAGAVVKRINYFATVMRRDQRSGARTERLLCLQTDLAALEQAIKHTPGCRLVIVDPISAYLGDIDSHKNADVRTVLAPLAAIAARLRVAIILVNHRRKSTDGPVIHSSIGSIGFVGAVRSAWAAGKDPKDSSGRRRLFLPMKNNLGNDIAGLSYELVGAENGTAMVAWGSEPVLTPADEAFAPAPRKRGPRPDERGRAERWLRDRLSKGPRLAEEVFDEAVHSEAMSKGTIRRAKGQLSVVSFRKEVPGPWWWRLPTEEDAQPLDQSTGADKPAHLEHLAESGRNNGDSSQSDSKVRTIPETDPVQNGNGTHASGSAPELEPCPELPATGTDGELFAGQATRHVEWALH